MGAVPLPGELEVRRVTAADWRAVKHLRLAALLDEPTAFCERWADAAALDDDGWRSRAADASFRVMAWDGARPVATAVGTPDDDGRPLAWLQGVHVAPDLRGRGVLERLVGAVAAWARGQGAQALHLEVHEGNARARAAYARLGFVPTGGRRPYPLDPASGDELELARRLAQA